MTCAGRSNSAGVAVTYVQGSPKGGGALGTLGVTNTRLLPVPLFSEEALMPVEQFQRPKQISPGIFGSAADDLSDNSYPRTNVDISR